MSEVVSAVIHAAISEVMGAFACCVACLIGVIICLWGDYKGQQLTLGLGKMFASGAFLTLGLTAPSPEVGAEHYQLLLCAALGASALGDLFLVWRSDAALLRGLGAFLLAHLLFAAAACSGLSGLSQLGLISALGAGVALLIGGQILSWLKPHVPRELWRPSLLYMVVISVMVGACLELAMLRSSWLIAGAALSFWLSDLSVARDRFLDEGIKTRLWGIPLYFIAQLMFGLSLYE